MDVGDLKTIALASVITWGIIEVVKPLLMILKITGGPKHNLIIRISSVLIGFCIGWYVYPLIVGEASPELLGGFLGASAGILNSSIVAMIKSKIKGKT